MFDILNNIHNNFSHVLKLHNSNGMYSINYICQI